MNVDLHCHSTASDGALAPAVLVARAFERGVRVLALTDHDTLEGLDEARQAAHSLGMQLVRTLTKQLKAKLVVTRSFPTGTHMEVTRE